MSPELAGKWISPMHPEIISDEPGPCPVCGMDLVSAESLGYLPAGVNEADMPLLIPATAPLITGKRAVVYVALPDQPGVFEGRVIELGPRAGQHYIVESGLNAGDLVVSHGAFKIDSAVQILAKPSMMNPGTGQGVGDEDRGGRAFEVPLGFQEQLRTTIDAYLPVASALSQDDLSAARAALDQLKPVIGKIDVNLLDDDAQVAWMEQLNAITSGFDAMQAAPDIESARTTFDSISNGLIEAGRTFGVGEGDPYYVLHCPMAFKNRGADWIQNKRGTENPYFGAAMFKCGEVEGILTGRDVATTSRASVSEEPPSHQH
jgi:Cu(I)/Ag(I) efflux system membrane fusion protein